MMPTEKVPVDDDACEPLMAASPEEHDEKQGQIVLHIKTLSEKPLSVEMDASATIGELKEIIKKKVNADGKFLRLIHQGKILGMDKHSVESYNIKSGEFIHCAISSTPPKAFIQQMNVEPHREDQDEQNRRGFDRLRDRLSREEVQALRLYFYPQLSAYIQQSETIPNESSESRIYRLEEEWMNAQGPQSEFALNVVPSARNETDADHHIDMTGLNGSFLTAENEGTATEFMWGFLMGILLGVFMLLMLLDRSVPRKQKIGLLLGVGMNFFLNVVPKTMSE